MHEELLPLFPLAVVLLPGTHLPLHIFEDRYKEMIGLAVNEGVEFGVVLASGEGLLQVGCTAVVEKVLRQYPDGRMDIVALGRRRFSILSLDQEKSYLRAAVSFFDDEGSGTGQELRERAMEACALFGAKRPEDPDDPQLSFHLGDAVEDLSFRQRLLMSRSEAERLRELIEFAPGYRESRVNAARLREAAPQNGHGKIPSRD
ncbi:MAG: LON peptidase substrate-binding domain-containing protein [Acidobacteriia bacterium]|nr:LON peptidase substrate-binding domain-containing protein [Terriglobia bacterium]